ncbi:MAG: hypothetical protein D4R67_09510 [Bacteroidetes bacterium]|nr:MAG: hypothetical protein D4R67_09510 [Bacteroidota bacterium]
MEDSVLIIFLTDLPYYGTKKRFDLHERENIHDPEALEANDYTIRILSDAYQHVQQFKPYAHLLTGFLDTGLFPEYIYPTVDIVLQLAQKVPPMENHPVGMTSWAEACEDPDLIENSIFVNQKIK